MPGVNESGWTIDTLHEHIDSRFAAQDKAVEVALARVDREFHEHLVQVRTETAASLNAAEKAILKAEAATERRFESVNEFRAQLTDQASTFMPRREAEQRIGNNADKIDTLERRFSDSLQVVGSRLDLMHGRSAGVNQGWGYLVGAAGLTGAVVAIISHF